MRQITKKFEWRIEDYQEWTTNYPFGKEALSDTFSVSQGDSTDPAIFKLMVCPNGYKQESKHNLDVYLMNSGDTDVTVNCYFYIEKKNGLLVKCETELKNRTINKGSGYGTKSWLKSSFFGDNIETYLPNKALTIGCCVSLKGDSPTLDEIVSENKTTAEILQAHFESSKDTYDYSEFSDFEIVCKDQETKEDSTNESDVVFKCHKIILSFGSPVFKAMLRNNTLETIENRLVIHDIDSETVKKLLKYLYSGTVDPCMIDINLLAASHKYEIDKLKALCEITLAKNQDAENSIDTLISANIYGSKSFQEETIRIAISKWKDVKNGSNFKIIESYPSILIQLIDKLTGTE